MPVIHGSLNDEDFVAYHNLAKSKGMSAKELTESLVIAELHRLSNVVKPGEFKEG
jgi:hypothetical protein